MLGFATAKGHCQHLVHPTTASGGVHSFTALIVNYAIFHLVYYDLYPDGRV